MNANIIINVSAVLALLLSAAALVFLSPALLKAGYVCGGIMAVVACGVFAGWWGN